MVGVGLGCRCPAGWWSLWRSLGGWAAGLVGGCVRGAGLRSGGGVVGWVGGAGLGWGGGSFPVRGGVLSLFAGGSVPDLGVRVSAEWGLIGGGSRVGVHPRFIVGGGVGVCGRGGGGGGVR